MTARVIPILPHMRAESCKAKSCGCSRTCWCHTTTTRATSLKPTTGALHRSTSPSCSWFAVRDGSLISHAMQLLEKTSAEAGAAPAPPDRDLLFVVLHVLSQADPLLVQFWHESTQPASLALQAMQVVAHCDARCGADHGHAWCRRRSL